MITQSQSLDYCNAVRLYAESNGFIAGPCFLVNGFGRPAPATYPNSSFGYETPTYFQNGVSDGQGGPAYFPTPATGVTSGKNMGNGSNSNAMVADPINAGTGNKYLQDVDYVGGEWLTFGRFYNSTPNVIGAYIGAYWRHSFDRTLVIIGNPATSIALIRPDGKQEVFTKTNGVWTTDADITDVLTEIDNTQGTATGYTVFVGSSRQIETYNTAGLLQEVA